VDRTKANTVMKTNITQYKIESQNNSWSSQYRFLLLL
jgi:hypothetical protein